MAKKTAKNSTNQLPAGTLVRQSDGCTTCAETRAAPRLDVRKSPPYPVTAKTPETPSLVTPKPAPQTVKSVTFLLPICDAKSVSLSGDFNGWSTDATPMKRHEDGHWEVTVELAPGRYEYKLVRDGEWIPDLLAHEYVWNQHGTLNSVIEVRT